MSHRSSDRSSYSSSRKRHYDSYSSDSDDDRDRHRSSRSSRDRHSSSSRSSSRRRSRTPERDRYHSSSRSDSSRSHRSDSSSEKSHKRKADQMGEVSTEQEQKKQKLEAWKKKLEQDNLLKKLKEEKEKLEQQKAQENSHASGLHMKVANKKHENHDTANVFGMDDDDEPKIKEERVEDSNEEEDPLDAYMNGIHNEVAQLPNYNSNVITFDDIKTEVKEEEEEDDETLHQKFIEELKKRASEEPKQAPKKTLEDEMKATSTRDDDNIFKDILQDERVGIDDYIYMPQNAEEGPVNGPSILERATKTNRKDLKTVDHAKMNYPPFRKNFFILPKDLQGLTDIQLRDMRRDMGHIRVRGVHCPPPIKNWSQCGLSDIVERKVKELGFLAPYPIQKQAIPCIMMGRNVIGIAKTGSGKTMAFLLPMFRHIMDQPPLEEGDGPVAMIIAPTRELAMQIYDDLVPFAKDLNLQAVCAYGGASIAEQIAALKRGAHIVVCTPGRMIDLLCANRGRVTNLLRVTYVVMDEADRMFDMGFGPQISRIIDNIRPDRQIVLFSATFPKPLEALAKKFLKDSIEILVGGRSVACDKVKQFVEIRSDDSKFLRLLALLGEWNAKGNILIFVDTQNEVGNMFKDLVGVGYGEQCASLHGGMDQIDRDDTLALFKKNGSGKTILIATSVASRGLHVENLQLVINYTVPNHYEDYVHRVGRTGRAEKEGTAYTFITPEEDKYAADLVRALKVSGNQIPPELIKMADNYEKKKKLGTVDKNFAQHSMSGYVGQSGFKFDNNELNAKKKEMVRQVKSMGLEDEDVVGDLIEEEEAEAQKALEKEGEDAGPAETLGSVFKAQMKAKDTTPVPTTAINTPGINAMGAYQMEFEINDYPQQARFKITHKDAMYDIQYTTGASITCKGIYVDPSKPAPPGERKLYLLIEAPEIEAVKSARRMILRRIEEASYQAAASGQMDFARKATGRYSVI